MLRSNLLTNLSINTTQIMVKYEEVDDNSGNNKLIKKLLKVEKS